MNHQLIVIGSGSSKAENLSLRALEKIKHADTVVLRTGNMPIARLLKEQGIAFISLDNCYEMATDFEILNTLIYEQLCTYIGNTCYVVYGSAMDDCTVAYCTSKAKEQGIETEIIPGIALSDSIAAFLNVPGTYSTCTALDGASKRFDVRNNNIITCIDSKVQASELKCRLLEYFADELTVEFYIENEMGEAAKTSFALFELDRQPIYNHTAGLYIKSQSLLETVKYDYFHLIEIMERLRAKDGCPWDKEQTHKSITPYLLEEAYEAIDAIDEDAPEKLYDELGDVLLQVVFHAQIAKEHGEFNESDITDAVCKKMISRHPHIFSNVVANTSEQVLINWDIIKKDEKQLKTHSEIIRDVPKALPALARAQKIQQKAAKAGFDWADFIGAFEKLPEEFLELKQALASGDKQSIEDETGDLLFTIVNIARHMGVQSELALYHSTEKFILRFEIMEQIILAEDKILQELKLVELDLYWEKAKEKLRL